MASSRATLSLRERKAIQAYVTKLVSATDGGQTGTKEILGISQAAVWKAEKNADAGPLVLAAVLRHSGLSHDAFLEKHGPPASTDLAVVVAEHPGKWTPDVVESYLAQYGYKKSPTIAQRLDDLAKTLREDEATGRASRVHSSSVNGPGGNGSTGSGTPKGRARRSG